MTDELARVGAVPARRAASESRTLLQAALKTPETGAFSAEDVRAIAHVRKAHGLSRDAVIDGPLLNVVVHFCAHHHMQDDAIHLVVAYHGLDLSDTLAVRFDPAQMIPMATTFEVDELAPDRARPSPRRTAARRASSAPVSAALAEAGRRAPVRHRARLAGLADWTAAAAAEFDAARVTDPRALRGIQQALRVPPRGVAPTTTPCRRSWLQTASSLRGRREDRRGDPGRARQRARGRGPRTRRSGSSSTTSGSRTAASWPPRSTSPSRWRGVRARRRGLAHARRDPVRASALFALPPAHVVLTIAKAFEALRLSGQRVRRRPAELPAGQVRVLDQGNTPDDFTCSWSRWRRSCGSGRRWSPRAADRNSPTT